MVSAASLCMTKLGNGRERKAQSVAQPARLKLGRRRCPIDDAQPAQPLPHQPHPSRIAGRAKRQAHESDGRWTDGGPGNADGAGNADDADDAGHGSRLGAVTWRAHCLPNPPALSASGTPLHRRRAWLAGADAPFPVWPWRSVLAPLCVHDRGRPHRDSSALSYRKSGRGARSRRGTRVNVDGALTFSYFPSVHLPFPKRPPHATGPSFHKWFHRAESIMQGFGHAVAWLGDSARNGGHCEPYV